MLSFKPAFSLSFFTFIKRLFSSSSLSAIRVVSSAYLRLLIFLPAVLIVQLVKNPPAMQFDSWVRNIHWRRDKLSTQVFLGFLCGSANKESACNLGDLAPVPGLGRSPGEGNGDLIQYSCLENPMDRGAWWAASHMSMGSQRVGHACATNMT